MKADFQNSNPVVVPLGRDGEITEWLAVKPRTDGKVRSMTMAEAINHHVFDVWKFPERQSNAHDVAHLLLALAYGENAKPHYYQGNLEAERVVLAIQRFIETAEKPKPFLEQRRIDKQSFIRSANHYHDMFYSTAMMYRTLIHAVATNRMARGEQAGITVEEIRHETGHERLPLIALAEKEGAVLSLALRLGDYFHFADFTITTASEKYYYRFADDAWPRETHKNMPPESATFQDMPPLSDEMLSQIYDRVIPAICLLNERYNSPDLNGDPLASMEMADLFNVMKDIPAAKPMASIQVFSAVNTQPVPVMT